MKTLFAILIVLGLAGCGRTERERMLLAISDLQVQLATAQAKVEQLEDAKGIRLPKGDQGTLGISFDDYTSSLKGLSGRPFDFVADATDASKWDAIDKEKSLTVSLWLDDKKQVQAATLIFSTPENFWLEEPRPKFTSELQIISVFVTATRCDISFQQVEAMVATVLDKSMRECDGLVLSRTDPKVHCRVARDFKGNNVRVDLTSNE